MDIIKELSKIGIVPVIKIDDAKDAAPLAKALINGGLPCAEVTFRTAAAEDAIAAMAKEYPEYGFEVHKGYGTKAHYEALRAHGHSAIHRVSFLKKFYGEK